MAGIPDLVVTLGLQLTDVLLLSLIQAVQHCARSQVGELVESWLMRTDFQVVLVDELSVIEQRVIGVELSCLIGIGI